MNAREKKNKGKNRQDELFDIAHIDANEVITNDDDKEFLHLQRAGRKGIIAGIDKNEKIRELEMNL